jgi:hypothetical protein
MVSGPRGPDRDFRGSADASGASMTDQHPWWRKVRWHAYLPGERAWPVTVKLTAAIAATGELTAKVTRFHSNLMK